MYQVWYRLFHCYYFILLTALFITVRHNHICLILSIKYLLVFKYLSFSGVSPCHSHPLVCLLVAWMALCSVNLLLNNISCKKCEENYFNLIENVLGILWT